MILEKLKNIFLFDVWNYFFHRKRIHSLIWCLNKTVRQQKKDASLVPIIIINYNRLSDLQQLVNFLLERKHKKIVIVDNNSSYPPLLEYYKEMENKVVIERMDGNYGHLVFWRKEGLFEKYGLGYYVVTDSDIIPNSNLSEDYLSRMMKILDENKKVSKVGFALKIDDIPNHYALKDKVLEWEVQHWNKPIGENRYNADIDTTFAIYPPRFRFVHMDDFYPGIRLGGDFEAKHMGWYSDKDNMTEEEIYYYKTANSSNNW